VSTLFVLLFEICAYCAAPEK